MASGLLDGHVLRFAFLAVWRQEQAALELEKGEIKAAEVRDLVTLPSSKLFLCPSPRTRHK